MESRVAREARCRGSQNPPPHARPAYAATEKVPGTFFLGAQNAYDTATPFARGVITGVTESRAFAAEPGAPGAR